MAVVSTFAVRLTDGNGYMFSRIETLQPRTRTWTDMAGRVQAFNEYYWLHRPLYDPKSMLNVTTC